MLVMGAIPTDGTIDRRGTATRAQRDSTGNRKRGDLECRWAVFFPFGGRKRKKKYTVFDRYSRIHPLCSRDRTDGSVEKRRLERDYLLASPPTAQQDAVAEAAADDDAQRDAARPCPHQRADRVGFHTRAFVVCSIAPPSFSFFFPCQSPPFFTWPRCLCRDDPARRRPKTITLSFPSVSPPFLFFSLFPHVVRHIVHPLFFHSPTCTAEERKKHSCHNRKCTVPPFLALASICSENLRHTPPTENVVKKKKSATTDWHRSCARQRPSKGRKKKKSHKGIPQAKKTVFFCGHPTHVGVVFRLFAPSDRAVALPRPKIGVIRFVGLCPNFF